MEAEIKIVSSHVVPYVVCEPVVANATKCYSNLRHHGREGMAKETHTYHANLLTHEAGRLLRESRGILVQDILNLAKEHGGELNDMIFAQARDRWPDAPDACCLLTGLADFYVSGKVSKEWFRSIFGPQFGATGLGEVLSTAMHRRCHEFCARPETVDFHADDPYPHNRKQGSGGSGLGGSTYNHEARKRLMRLQLSLLRWPADEAWPEAMEFPDAPGQKAERVPRGIAPLADVASGSQVVKKSRRRGEKRRNAVDLRSARMSTMIQAPVRNEGGNACCHEVAGHGVSGHWEGVRVLKCN